jgi:hypothetical protein
MQFYYDLWGLYNLIFLTILLLLGCATGDHVQLAHGHCSPPQLSDLCVNNCTCHNEQTLIFLTTFTIASKHLLSVTVCQELLTMNG